MKCENVIQNIEKYFNGWAGELNLKTRTHLETCQDCKMHFMAHDKASELITRIRDFEPELKDPSGLTDDIMASLPDREHEKKIKKFNILQNRVFRWSISAAAIILFSLFAFEQYIVLDKINRLETQYQNVSKKKSAGNNTRAHNAWEVQTIKNYNHLKASNRELLQKISSLAGNI